MKNTTTPTQPRSFQPEHFINRELSWLEFNARVLEEAEDESNPLLERVKFLAIVSSNLDEFFMVRVAGLREQAFGVAMPQDSPPDGLRPIDQLREISARTRKLVAAQYRCWNDSIRPLLAERDIHILKHDELKKDQRREVDDFFRQRAFPVLTPMAIDPSHPSPRFHNRGLYLVAMLERMRGLGPKQLFAVVQVPQILPRLVPITSGKRVEYILLEDIIAARLADLFGGYEIIEDDTFRITRDMDIELLEQESDDILRLIETRLRARQRSNAVRLEVPTGICGNMLDVLVEEELLHTTDSSEQDKYNEVYYIDGMLDLTSLFALTRLSGLDDLRDPPLTSARRSGLGRTDDLFAEISDHDILLHHPFDSFNPVVDFIERAAEDPKVLAIKQTLYRTSGDSPVIGALVAAAESGKHVTALVELKARFDEANNITWARQMERAGVHVVFGFLDLKTHCKIALVVRQEGGRVQRYVHLSTGNYNPITARLYTDIGLFTSDPIMAEDASALFNLLTGYSQNHHWEKLVVAPKDLRERTNELIERQTTAARRGKPARIFAKLNSLVDRSTIRALYRASQAGVSIDLVVRGICCLRPGLSGVSENIRVRSIVDRFLEHSRIFVFGEGDKAQVFLSSADWMPRNFDRRVEVMFPIEDDDLRKQILNDIVPRYLEDNTRARILFPDGNYMRAEIAPDEPIQRAQHDLLQWHADFAALSIKQKNEQLFSIEQNGKLKAKQGKRKKKKKAAT